MSFAFLQRSNLRKALGCAATCMLGLGDGASIVPPSFAQSKDTLVVGFGADPASTEAARTMGLHNNRMVLQIFDTLLLFFGDTSERQPGLAVSSEITLDNPGYTFQLR